MKLSVVSYLIFFILSICVSLNAKVSARDILEKDLMAWMGDVPYDCEGNDKVASCSARSIDLENGISLNDVKVKYVLTGDKSYKRDIIFSVGLKSIESDITNFMDVIPKSVSYNESGNLQGETLSINLTYSISSKAYKLDSTGSIDVKSKTFTSQGAFASQHMLDLNKMLSSNLTDETYQVNPKEFFIELNSFKLGERIFEIVKKHGEITTKEQYDATINAGVAMMILTLANEKSVSQSSINQINKIGLAIADVLTSKKSRVSIALKRKSKTMLELSDSVDFLHKIKANPFFILTYLDDNYNVSLSSR